MKRFKYRCFKAFIRSPLTFHYFSNAQISLVKTLRYDVQRRYFGTKILKEKPANDNTEFDGLWQHFLFMKRNMNPVDSYMYARLLQRCTSTESIADGIIVHAHLIKSGDEIDIVVWNTLLNMYGKCGLVKVAHKVFDKMPERNLVSWTAMIGAYSQHGYGKDALKLFREVLLAGLELNQFTFVCVLKACASLGSLEHGEQVLACIVKVGFESNVYVGSALVDMFAKCGNIDDATRVFGKAVEADMVSWTTMITGYAQNGYGEEAVELFCQMLMAGVNPNHFTFSSVLKACADLIALEEGKQVHAHIVKRRYESNAFVGISLINLYATCGKLGNAVKVFEKMPERDMVSWTAMIVRCAQNKHGEEALTIFSEMQQAGLKHNQFTSVGVLNACAGLHALEQGKQAQGHLIKVGCESDVVVGSALVDMYAKCGSIEDARKVFDKMPDRNEVSWNTMIDGYVQAGYIKMALKLLFKMNERGVKPNQVTFISILGVYASLASLQQGFQFHAYISKNVFWSDVCVGNALVDMYAKCGTIIDAQKVFDQMPKRDEVSWNTIIAGSAHHGHGEKAIQLFEKMQLVGLKPDHITFVGVLSACSHSGLVDEGRHYFDSMSQDYGILPTMQHYACMVNLFGRSGHLVEAEDFIKRMPVKPGVVVWQSLLSACRIHGNAELGKYAAERALELEPQKDATHVLLSNIYAAAGRWNDVAKVRKLMDDKGLKKELGLSWIEVKTRVHSFAVGDKTHPRIEEIHAKLNSLTVQMKEIGYIPNTSFVLRDVEQEQKEHSLSHHSEKLAIAFGLISTPFGTPIRVFKNLRICGDCHTAIKFISKIAGREIVVRDTNRFHHFESGLCSCRGFW